MIIIMSVALLWFAMVSKISPKDIATESGLDGSELTKPCKECFFPKLAQFVHPWREIFSSLLGEVDLSDVDSENRDRSEQEKG